MTAIEEVMIALRSQRNVIDTALASLRVAFALEDTPSFVPQDEPTPEPPVSKPEESRPLQEISVKRAEIIPEIIPAIGKDQLIKSAPAPYKISPESPKPTGPAPNAPAEDFDGLRRTGGIQDTATLRTMIVAALTSIGKPAAVSEITAACRLASDKKIYPSAIERVIDGMLTDDVVKLADKANYGPGDVERWVLVDPDWTPTPRAGRSQAELREHDA